MNKFLKKNLLLIQTFYRNTKSIYKGNWLVFFSGFVSAMVLIALITLFI
jgi:hypothetical protein